MAGLVTASRVYPTCGAQYTCNSGKPELRCHPRLALRPKDVDARDISAFHARLRRAMRGHDELETAIIDMRGKAVHFAANSARSLKRWILPVAVFGRSVRNSIQRGYL